MAGKFLTRGKTGAALVMLVALVLVGVNSLSVKGRTNGGGSGGGGGQVCQTKISGNGEEWTLDPQVQFSTDNGGTWAPAFIVPPNADVPEFTYDIIPGTHYVSVTADRSDPKPGGGTSDVGGALFDTDYLFRTTFTMAGGFTNPSLSVEVNSDNTTAVSLNNHPIGNQTFIEDAANFKNPADLITTTNASFFVVGINTLVFKLHNFHNQIALDFKATICTQTGCVDEDPPSVSCSVAQTQLWPPNHDLECVGLTARVTDDCDCSRGGRDDDDDDDGHHGHGNETKSQTGGGNHGDDDDDDGGQGDDDDDGHHGDDDDDGDHGDDDDDCRNGGPATHVVVYSDEPDLDIPGSGNFSPDAKNIGLSTLRLRSERSGNGDGRVYLIVVSATDRTGKVGYCAKTVTVPHDQSRASKNAVQAAANAARTYFLANHVRPPGYVQVGIGPIRGPKQ